MAVLPACRNQGIGSQLLRFVLKHTADQQLKQVTLHAQTAALPFYEKHGFTVHGELFYEANIPHRGMLLNIKGE
jgi:predicted GNAT family N-acyltransferase